MSKSPRDFLTLLKSVKKELDGIPSPEEMRADLADFARRIQVAEGVNVEERKLNQVPCLQISPGTKSASHILYFHGGGYISGSPQSHLGLTSLLAQQANAVVWSADYRLAPESPFPAALEDAVSCYRALLEQEGVPASRIVISGDSAGGGLALASMLVAKQKDLPMPAGLALMSPFADLTLSGGSHNVAHERDFLATPEVIEVMATWYAGAHDKSDPRVSPCFGEFSGFPPMKIHAGSEEVLLSDSTRIAERAGLDRVMVDLKIWPDMPHVFQLHTKFLADAVASVSELSTWISERLNAS